jgi:hypothetical protein
VVPEWSLAVAFVAGLAVGVVGCRLVMGRGRSTEKPALAAPTEPEPAALSTPVEAPVETPAEEAGQEPVQEPAEDPASAVDDVVAELERRVKGRRTEGETDRTTGGRRGRSD